MPLNMNQDRLAGRLLAAAGVAMLLTLGTVGCAGSGSTDAGAEDSAESANAASAASETNRGSEAPVLRTVTVPAGTVIAISFDTELSSDSSAAGDRFEARVVDPVTVDGRVAIDGGTPVIGSVVAAVPSKKIGGTARLDLEFTDLYVAGETVPLSAVLVAQGKKQTKKDAATIGGAAAGGALLGNLIGDRKGKEAEGTQIGAVVGAAVGTAIAATNENDPVTIPAGTVVDIRLDAPVTLTRAR